MEKTYEIVDRHTGEVVGVYKDGKRARTRRDKLDLAYGASRYTVRVIYPDEK